MSIDRFNEKVSFIWSVADLLRGPYKPAQYGEVMLPMTVLRRLDCVLEPTRKKVTKRLESLKGGPVKDLEQKPGNEKVQSTLSRLQALGNTLQPRQVLLGKISLALGIIHLIIGDIIFF